MKNMSISNRLVQRVHCKFTLIRDSLYAHSSHGIWASSKVLWTQMTFRSMSLAKFFRKAVLWVFPISFSGKPTKRNIHFFANFFFCHLCKVRIMRKRLVRKAFDMILGISMSENREVRLSLLGARFGIVASVHFFFFFFLKLFGHVKILHLFAFLNYHFSMILFCLFILNDTWDSLLCRFLLFLTLLRASLSQSPFSLHFRYCLTPLSLCTFSFYSFAPLSSYNISLLCHSIFSLHFFTALSLSIFLLHFMLAF